MFELLKLWRVSTHSRPKAAALHSQLSPDDCAVSTHSRPKAAAYQRVFECRPHYGFNTQPPEGGCEDNGKTRIWGFVSTHSRPKAAAPPTKRLHLIQPVSTHSRPKAAAAQAYAQHLEIQSFNTQPPEGGCNGRLAYGLKLVVSTHSRPKAAAYLLNLPCDASLVSTHSRPKAAAPYIKKQEKSVY